MGSQLIDGNMLTRRDEISVRRVRSLLTVIELNSFTRAADTLGLSQPAVSQHVRQLEEQIGFPLLTRVQDGLSLSPAGSSLLPAFRRLVADNETIIRQLALLNQGAKQILRMASVASFAAMFVGPAYQAVRPEFPDHVLDILEIDGEETFRLLRSGEIDIGISSVFVPSPGLRFERLCEDAACVVLSANHPLAGRTELSDEEVLAQPVVRFPSGTTSGNWLAAIAERAGQQPRAIIEVRQLLTGCHLAQQGLAIAVVPEIGARSCPFAGLVTIPLREPLSPRRLGLVSREEHQPSQFEVRLLAKISAMSGGNLHSRSLTHEQHR